MGGLLGEEETPKPSSLPSKTVRPEKDKPPSSARPLQPAKSSLAQPIPKLQTIKQVQQGQSEARLQSLSNNRLEKEPSLIESPLALPQIKQAKSEKDLQNQQAVRESQQQQIIQRQDTQKLNSQLRDEEIAYSVVGQSEKEALGREGPEDEGRRGTKRKQRRQKESLYGRMKDLCKVAYG